MNRALSTHSGTRLTTTLYRELARTTVPWCTGLYSRPFTVGDVARVRGSVGVYIACGHDGTVRYVGMVSRSGQPHAIGTRVGEHLRTGRRAWELVWIIPLR